MLVPSNSDSRIEGDDRRFRWTNFVLGGYVVLGVFLIGIRSKLQSIFTPTQRCELLILAILSFVAGLVAIHFRRRVLHRHRTFYRDITILTTPDNETIFQGLVLLAAGFGGIMIGATNVEVFHLLLLILMVVSVGLNTYFGSFLFEKPMFGDYQAHIESLKLAHQEWSTIFNNVCLALLVTVGGIALGFMKPSSAVPSTTATTVETFLDALLICYAVLGAPIVWLLRPIHNLMASIRRDIARLKCPNK